MASGLTMLPSTAPSIRPITDIYICGARVMLVLDLPASANKKKNALLMTVSMETVRVERSDLRLNLKATEIISLKN